MDATELLLARRGRRISQAELGRQLGVSRMTVSRWEWGAYSIPAKTVPQILGALYGSEVEVEKSGGRRSLAA